MTFETAKKVFQGSETHSATALDCKLEFPSSDQVRDEKGLFERVEWLVHDFQLYV